MNELRGLWRGKSAGNGKLKKDGEWVKGFSIARDFDLGIISIGVWEYWQDEDGKQRKEQYYNIDPTTLGECIGRCDKNNKPIFEGDIVRTKYGRLCLVVWCSHSSFVGVDLDALEADHKAPSEYDLYDCLEIVGNCYDNPNLLALNKT